MRLGIIGAGRVFERLYRRALLHVREIESVAVADPVAPEHPPAGVALFRSVEAMLSAGGLDAVAVLSPPRLHAEHARLALAAGLRVLVEKPVAMSLDELTEVLAAGAPGTLTPAFPRRYWPAYRRIGPGLRRLELVTNPEEWGARSGHAEEPAFDLLPHLVDLACLAKGDAPVAVFASPGANPAGARLRFGDGSEVLCRAAHGEAYREWFVQGRGQERVGPSGLGTNLWRQARRAAPVEVSGVAALLRSWAAGASEAPGERDAWNSVTIVDSYRRSVESGRDEPVAPWRARLSRGDGAFRGDR